MRLIGPRGVLSLSDGSFRGQGGAVSWSSGITVAVVLVAAVLTTGAAYAQVTTTLREILADPDRFDGQVVTIEGTMTNLKQRVTRHGDVYYKFDLSDGTQAIRVVSLGRSPCQSGAVTVEGTFAKMKRGRQHTSYNVVNASRVICRQEKSRPEHGWRATFYATGMEHSPTSAIWTSWERTPKHAVQRAAWEALTYAERDAR